MNAMALIRVNTVCLLMSDQFWNMSSQNKGLKGHNSMSCPFKLEKLFLALHSVSADISNWLKGSRGKKLLRWMRELSINSTWTT